MDYKIIGQILKEERKYRETSQKELASELAIHQTTICRLEKGEGYKNEAYLKLLQFYQIPLYGNDEQLQDYLNEIIHAMEYNLKEKEEEVYAKVELLTQLSYKGYYQQKLVSALHALFHKDFSTLFSLIDYLNHFEFVFDENWSKTYHFIKGYVYHIKKDYQKADQEFLKIIPYLIKYDLYDPLFSYIYAWNQIILGHYNTAQLFLENSRKDTLKKDNIDRLVHLNRLLAYIYFLNSNYKESIETLKDFFIHSNDVINSPQVIEQAEFVLSSSYILLGEYDEAVNYLFKLVSNDSNEFVSIYYAYLMYCLKQANHSLYNSTLNKIKDSFSDETVKLVLSFILDEQESEQWLYKFDYISEKINNQELISYVHGKLLLSLFQQEIWKRRKYAVYKKLNTNIIERVIEGSL